MVRIGHIDGKGEIYDDKGYLIAKSGEEIIKIYENDTFVLKKDWKSSKWFPKTIFDPRAGEGTLYITNKRIVFIRTPNLDADAYHRLDPFSAPSTIPKIMEARDLLKMGAKEYCEIELSDVVRIIEKSKESYIFLQNRSGEKFTTVVWTNQLDIIRKVIG